MSIGAVFQCWRWIYGLDFLLSTRERRLSEEAPSFGLITVALTRSPDKWKRGRPGEMTIEIGSAFIEFVD